MTGTMELSDQDVRDLVGCIDRATLSIFIPEDLEKRLEDLKEHLLKVEVNTT